MVELLFKLLAGHALADFALQNDFIANNKNRHASPKGYDPKLHGAQAKIWPYVLTAHALIHGLMVYLCTGLVLFAMIEVAMHWLIDFGKCEKWYGIHIDQWLHILCKVIYAIVVIAGTT